MVVVEAEGLGWRVTVGGEDEAMQVDICNPDGPQSLPCNVFEVVTCRGASASTSVKKKFKN